MKLISFGTPTSTPASSGFPAEGRNTVSLGFTERTEPARHTGAAAVRFEPYDPTQPGPSERVSVQPVAGPTRHVTVRHFRVTFLDDREQPIGESVTFSVAYPKETDVLDLVPYVMGPDGPRMAIVETLKPLIAARRFLDVPALEGEPPPDGRHWSLPSALIRQDDGETSFPATARNLLERKVGLESSGPLESLGSGGYPSVGSSTELCFMVAAPLSPGEVPAERVAYGRDFAGLTHTRFIDVQSAVRGYVQGTYRDFRLALGAFRLARQKGLSLRVDLPLTSHTASRTLAGVERRIATAEQMRALARSAPTASHITHVSIDEYPAPEAPFLTSQRFLAYNHDRRGDVTSSYLTDAVVRKGVDSVDVGAYFWHAGRLYLPVKRGVRPSIAVRELQTHPVHTDASVLHFEGIAGSLSGQKTVAEIAGVAALEVEEEGGIFPASAPVYVGFDYPSPGYCPERTYRFLTEVDPSRESSKRGAADEAVDVRYVELEDVLALCDEGVIRSPRLELEAHLLKAAFRYESRRPDSSATPEERAGFQALVNEGSKIQALLAQRAPRIHSHLRQLTVYRRLLNYCENELGLVAMSLDHPEEQKFFSPGIPIFTVQATDPRKYPFYVLHDARHYSTGEFIPFVRGANGEPQPVGYEEFRLACAGNECDAVWFSDVIVPELMGLSEAEKIFGGVSVARVFRELGLSDAEKREAIISIELHGCIPAKVIRHPLFEKYRDVLVGRLLRFHVMDSIQSKVIYDTWVSNPEVARTALRFCVAFDDRATYEDYFEESLRRVMRYAEGMNPLKAHLGRTLNFDMRVQALRLAHLRQELRKTGAAGATEAARDIEAAIDRLHEAFQKLSAMNSDIHDIELSETNLRAFRYLRTCREEAIVPAKALGDRLSQDATLLTAPQREALQGRVLPFFKDINMMRMDDVPERVERLEQESRRAAGAVV